MEAPLPVIQLVATHGRDLAVSDAGGCLFESAEVILHELGEPTDHGRRGSAEGRGSRRLDHRRGARGHPRRARASSRLSPAAVVLAATVTLLLSGVIDAAQAFAGFANPAPLTVAALYVLARAVQKTGLMAPLTAAVLGRSRGTTALARLVGPTAASSAFLNNTPLVAMLIPDVMRWARKRRESASRLLLPVSYAAILGGMVTAIGTSTTLVVSGLLEARGSEPFGMFEVTVVGLPVAVVGLAVVLLTSRLLPRREDVPEQLESHGREFVVSMEVERDGPLQGATVARAGLRDLDGVYLVELVREGESITPPNPDVVLRGGDLLTFAGRVDQIVDLQTTRGLRFAESDQVLQIDSPQHTFFEAVVGRSSVLSGRTLKEARFRSRYQAAVVAIQRDGQRVDAKLGDVRLRPTDTLLVLARPGFAQRWRANTDFLLVAHVGGEPPSASRRAPLVGLVALAVVVTAAVGLLPILEASLLGAAVLVVTGVLSYSEARDAIDLDVVVLIGAAFGLGAAIETSGLALEVAGGLTDLLSGWGEFGLVLGIVLATIALTEVVTNNAAAVVVFPIAWSIAGPAGLDPRSISIVVAIAASASFLTPIGYQTNTMVYGPGGYRFGDYLRAGWPLTLAVAASLTVGGVLTS
ncbi:MAG: SLC13 family permease [Microthrixaceae bacterium]